MLHRLKISVRRPLVQAVISPAHSFAGSRLKGQLVVFRVSRSAADALELMPAAAVGV